MSEYPDHLNPFKEKKKLGRSLTKSFREFKGFIRQSLRKKKSKSGTDEGFGDVEIRRPQDSYNTLRNNVMSLPSRPTYSTYTLTSPPLPRSRFKERLARSSLNSFYDEKCNPFAEEGFNPFDDPPVPYRRRKSKKRAPLPPSCSNPDVNLGYKMRGSSKWSLTSSETDYTFDDKSELSGDVAYSQSLKDCLDQFNKEMDNLNKEPSNIGGSSPTILDSRISRQVFDTDTEYMGESKLSSDSVDEVGNREINNNVIDLTNGTEITRETSETKTSSEEKPDMDHPNLEESEVNSKLPEADYNAPSIIISDHNSKLDYGKIETQETQNECNLNESEFNEKNDGSDINSQINTPKAIISDNQNNSRRDSDAEENQEGSSELSSEEVLNKINLDKINVEEKPATYAEKQKDLNHTDVEVTEVDVMYKYNNSELQDGKANNNETNSRTLIVGDTKIIHSESESIPEITEKMENEHNIKMKEESENYSIIFEGVKVYPVNLYEQKTMKQQELLHVNEIEMSYMDEDNSLSENMQENDKSNGSYITVENTYSKDPSPTPKQRKYKLDKVVLLGENSLPKS